MKASGGEAESRRYRRSTGAASALPNYGGRFNPPKSANGLQSHGIPRGSNIDEDVGAGRA